MTVIMQTGTRVRANWLNQGKFYDARIVSIEPTGFCVQYLESEEVESGLQEEDIIGIIPPPLFSTRTPLTSCTYSQGRRSTRSNALTSSVTQK